MLHYIIVYHSSMKQLSLQLIPDQQEIDSFNELYEYVSIYIQMLVFHNEIITCLQQLDLYLDDLFELLTQGYQQYILTDSGLNTINKFHSKQEIYDLQELQDWLHSKDSDNLLNNTEKLFEIFDDLDKTEHFTVVNTIYTNVEEYHCNDVVEYLKRSFQEKYS